MIHCCPQCTRFYECLAEMRGYVCGTPWVWRCPACASAHAKAQGARNYPEILIVYVSKDDAQMAWIDPRHFESPHHSAE
jgi:hypothetical protein